MIKDKVSFHEMMKVLDEGGYAFLANGCILFKQIPAEIMPDTIPLLKSVPDLVKQRMLFLIDKESAKSAKYENQYIKMNQQLRMTYYIFTNDDINSNDWTVVVKD